MEIFIVVCVIIIGYGVYQLIKSVVSGDIGGSVNTNIQSDQDRDVEDLHRMQKFNFWRDFDKH